MNELNSNTVPSAMACPSTCRSQAATRRLLKGVEYSRITSFRKRIVQGILAIGSAWISASESGANSSSMR